MRKKYFSIKNQYGIIKLLQLNIKKVIWQKVNESINDTAKKSAFVG